MPVETRTRIGLASRRYVAVTNYCFDRMVLAKLCQQLIQRLILCVLEGPLVTAFELDAYGKIVAVFTPLPTGGAGMPCTP